MNELSINLQDKNITCLYITSATHPKSLHDVTFVFLLYLFVCSIVSIIRKYACVTLIDRLDQVTWSVTLQFSQARIQLFQENRHFIFERL